MAGGDDRERERLERGRRIKVARENAGLTKRGLADLVGANEDSVRLWEDRGVFPRDYIGKLREVLNLDEGLLPLEREQGRDPSLMTNPELVAEMHRLLAEAARLAVAIQARLAAQGPESGEPRRGPLDAGPDRRPEGIIRREDPNGGAGGRREA